MYFTILGFFVLGMAVDKVYSDIDFVETQMDYVRILGRCEEEIKRERPVVLNSPPNSAVLSNSFVPPRPHSPFSLFLYPLSFTPYFLICRAVSTVVRLASQILRISLQISVALSSYVHRPVCLPPSEAP